MNTEFENFKTYFITYSRYRTLWRKAIVNSPEFLQYDDLKYEYEQLIYEEINRLLIKIAIYTNPDKKFGKEVKSGLQAFDLHLKEYNRAVDIWQEGKTDLWVASAYNEYNYDYVTASYKGLLSYVETLYHKVEEIDNGV